MPRSSYSSNGKLPTRTRCSDELPTGPFSHRNLVDNFSDLPLDGRELASTHYNLDCADDFNDVNKLWVRQMAADLLLILDNVLKYSGANEKCAYVAKVFATGLGAGSLDDYPDVKPSVDFLMNLRSQLANALE